jgi:hypothetical protein
MEVNILTKEDLHQFKTDLVAELKAILKIAAEPPKKWLKSEEVKKLLNVSPGTLQTLRINGTLQYTKIGKIIYYDFEHLQKTMEKNLRVASSESS